MRMRQVVLLLLVLTGCANLPLVGRLDERLQAGRLLARAEALAESGDYSAAEEAYREVLGHSPQSASGERALLGMARLYTVPENPKQDYRQALEYFDRFIHEYPRSEWARDARAWRGVLAALQSARQVGEEVQALRQAVDRLQPLEAELERRRKELEEVGHEIEGLRREARRAREEVRRTRLDPERLKLLELELQRRGLELAEARREVVRLRHEAQQAREEALRIQEDLERLKQLELELERQRRR